MTLPINQIIQADCLDFMKTLPDKCVDIVITSPPYNVGANKCPDRKNIKYNHMQDDMDEQCYLDFLMPRLQEMIRISAYVFFNIQSLSKNKKALISLKYEFRNFFKDEIIWIKTNPAPAINKGCLSSGFEYIWIFSSEDNVGRSFSGEQWRGIYRNYIETPCFTNNEYRNIHNACFPEDIPRYCLNIVSKRCIVLDPFCGTGTTLAVADKLGHKWIGVEISEQYCQIARKRVKKAQEQFALLELGK